MGVLLERGAVLFGEVSPLSVRGCKMTGRALVVGASGGIGAALCKALAARGDDVTGLSRTADGLDYSDPPSVESAMGRLDGSFDKVIVATGVLAPDGTRPEKSLTEVSADHMAHVMAVNAIGPALILRHVPRLLSRKGRSVVGVLTARVGSIGDNGLGGWYSYRAAKAAANQIVHTAAIEMSRTHKEAIIVALHPGTVETSFTEAYQTHPKVTPDEAASNLLDVLDGLKTSQTGGFFDWAGKAVPW